MLRFSYRKANETVLAYDVRTWLNQLERDELYMPVHLLGKSRAVNVAFMMDSGVLVQFIALSSGMNTEMGMLAKGDLLQYVCNGVDVLGSAIGFASTSCSRVAAFVNPYSRMDGGVLWKRESDDVAVVWAGDVVGSVPYAFLDSERIAAVMFAK